MKRIIPDIQVHVLVSEAMIERLVNIWNTVSAWTSGSWSNNKHFSQLSKSGNLNLSRKADHNFRGNLLQNHFRNLRLCSKTPGLLVRSRCLTRVFWKTKGWSSYFWKVFLRGISPPKKTETTKTGISKIWSVFYEEIFISEKSVV